MPSGFQSFNDYGRFQIDGQYKNLGLIRKGVVTTQDDQDYGSPVATFTVNVGEIFAMRCETAAAVVAWKEGASVTVKAGGTGSSHDVEYYIFGDPVQTSTIGMQVFDETGSIVFDSGEKPLNVITPFSGEGTFQGNSGRKYAVIPSNQHVYVYRNLGPVLYPPSGRREQIQITSGSFRNYGVDVSFFDGIVLNYIYQNPSGTPPTYQEWEWDNGVSNLHIIVDVTNF